MRFITDLSKGILGGGDPPELWQEIIGNIPDELLLKPDVKILSVACGHGTEAALISRRMLSLGISKERVRSSVYLIDKYRQFTRYVTDTYGFTNVITGDFLQQDFGDMRFDLVVGNPPFSKGKQPLYPAFFKKSMELADMVAMVMPVNLTSPNQKSHNNPINRHLIKLSDTVNHHFPTVSAGDVRYVIASNSVKNTIAEHADELNNYVPVMPENRRLKFIRGVTGITNTTNIDEVDGVRCVESVQRDGIKYRKVKATVVSKATTKLACQSPYFVLVNRHPSGGLFNTQVVENTRDLVWSDSVYALPAESEVEAKTLADWVTSRVMVEEINKLMGIRNTYAISGKMLGMLPHYLPSDDTNLKLF